MKKSIIMAFFICSLFMIFNAFRFYFLRQTKGYLIRNNNEQIKISLSLWKKTANNNFYTEKAKMEHMQELIRFLDNTSNHQLSFLELRNGKARAKFYVTDN